METLVLVAEHRNQYFSRGKSQAYARLGSSPSKGFREFSCRSFESSRGLPSPPLGVCSTPLSNRSVSSPKTPTPAGNPSYSSRGDGKFSKENVKSSPIPTGFKCGRQEITCDDSSPFSELWAGPAYSNSPPPSSLPMPKFSLKTKRTVSLELPPAEPEIDLHPAAISAPSSPTGELNHSAFSFLHDDDNATKTLRRILNLDIAD